ncbi:radical SAM protein, partial [candidate division KSB1 bacterium]
RKPIENLDEIPFPAWDLFPISNYWKLGYSHTPFKKTFLPILTSRGCPFNCSFCSVTGMFGKKYRFRSTENIIEELRNYNHNKNVIFFYDDNFTANRERAKELCKAMIKENFKFKWSTQVRVDIAKDEELVRLMKKSGCHTLYIGFESVNPESLKEMQKSQSVEDIKSAIKILKKYKIHIHGMFVYGFDTDTEGSIRETLKFAKSSGISSAQFLILTPLPGSATYNALKNQGRIKFKEWSLYDAHHVVFEPVNLTMAQLQHAQIESHQKFYSFTQIVKHILAFRWLDLGIAYYARNLNRVWKKRNRIFLKIVDLLTPKKGVRISIDYRTDVNLEPQKRVA